MKLMSNSMKLFEHMIKNRPRRLVNISEEQLGFMKGKSATDAIFALRQVQEKYREGHKELYGVFMDLEEAFNRVTWGGALLVLAREEHPGKVHPHSPTCTRRARQW